MFRVPSFFLTLAVFLIGAISSHSEVTVTTSSTKGWSKTDTFNNLGLTTNSSLSGTGVPSAALTPTWRDDGSLSGVTFTAGGDTHSASFNNDGTLATLTAPGKGNILGGHSISGGTETLTVDGVTTITKLDGTETATSGGDVIGKTEELATNGSGFKQTTTPTVGAATEVTLNAAGAPTAKAYAAGAGESYTSYKGGLIHTVSLARGGDLTFGYSNDGAKDLTSATWPAVVSGQAPNAFNIPSEVQSYGHDRAGRVDEISDSSGARALVYQSGRLKQTTWNSGPLAGYKVVKGLDEYGRDTGFTLYRGSTVIHSAVKAPNGVSGEVSAISSGAITAIYGRDAARNITSITRGSVIQNWTRSGGRISSANSSVAAAPSFDYTQFDTQGRRKDCITTGGAWAYTYTNGRLTNAVHPTHGTFSYGFDAIGRRTDKGSANTTDLLNRTLAWTNSQNKTLKITAAPAAQVWFNGTQIPGFIGSHNHPIPSPGASGGWVPWHTIAVLPGQGDSGANPDAKAEQSGAVYIPPINENFTYDAAGNRESSALWDYGWNAKNQLVRARTKNHNSAAQGYDITNAYDSQSRRFSKKVNRYQNGAIVEQKFITFLHDGNDLIYERHQLPSGLTLLERRYLWGPDLSGTQGGAGGAGGLLLIQETKGNSTIELYPLYDGSGNVVALTDNTGDLQAEYAYGPFGELLYARGPHAQSCPFRFQTKYYDQETGLCMFTYRPYEPLTAQWLSRDPAGEKEDINLYQLTGGDPINYLDVAGLWRINTQEAANDQRVEWLLMQLSAGSGLPTAPLDEWKLYFPESGDFGLHKPYGPDDYKRAQTFVQDLGRPSIRSLTSEQAEVANSPSFRNQEWIPSATEALTLGAANTPLNASINSDWLLPTGAGAAGAKLLFGGMKAMLPLLATGARTEGQLLTTEMRAKEMLSSVAKLDYVPTSAAVLQGQAGRTSTILGSYQMDMKHIIAEMGNVKSLNFGAKPGGFNVLNVPDNLYRSPSQFWSQYNHPWLDKAVSRGDNFIFATKPDWSVFTRPNAVGKLELSGFGKEYLFLRKTGFPSQLGN